MSRVLALLYGVACYVLFLLTSGYAIGFVGDLVVPKSINSGMPGDFGRALLINVVLMAVFAAQHSVMARPGFKRWWTRIVPVTIERSTYVLLSSLALILLFWQWQAMPDVVWRVANTAGTATLWTLFWLGWATVIASSFLISHPDLFGLRQVYLNLKGRVYTRPEFRTPLFYRVVRHPIMLGFILAFWAAPIMTVGHLVFAVTTTVYILAALRLEEHDLVTIHGEVYQAYQRRVPMILPLPKSG